MRSQIDPMTKGYYSSIGRFASFYSYYCVSAPSVGSFMDIIFWMLLGLINDSFRFVRIKGKRVMTDR